MFEKSQSVNASNREAYKSINQINNLPILYVVQIYSQFIPLKNVRAKNSAKTNLAACLR